MSSGRSYGRAPFRKGDAFRGVTPTYSSREASSEGRRSLEKLCRKIAQGGSGNVSLVIGFSGTTGAVIAGDMREILMRGSDPAVRELEKDLDSGAIPDDRQLGKRARNLEIELVIRDDKAKVSEREGVLIGEVGETDGARVRKRRLYLSPGEYAIADIEGDNFRIRAREKKTGFIVLGNEATKKIAGDCIRRSGPACSFEDALKVVISVLERAASETASVSRRYILLQVRGKTPLSPLIRKDAREVTGGD